jgi:hypothetical protein
MRNLTRPLKWANVNLGQGPGLSTLCPSLVVLDEFENPLDENNGRWLLGNKDMTTHRGSARMSQLVLGCSANSFAQGWSA